jgi:aryl-alcohol dehydrogenase-like predicted oxidoreductase/histidinol phosphatase-like enzyme/predicted kinase
MRLSTRADRDDERSIEVVRTALDAGATLLDTADAYCLDDHDVGHNERLIAQAIDGWHGDHARITIATKGGMRRPSGAWVGDGRAKHLRDACHASRRALAVDAIDLYQLHAIDPKTPIETSVRALARLRDEGAIRNLGLCNVTVSQIRAAQAIVPIASVQVSLSPLDDENLRNGVAEYCRDEGIRLLAYRPLGSDRVKQLGKRTIASQLAAKHGTTAEEIALAWLMSFGDGVVPIPGATRVATAASLARALAIELDEADRAELDACFAGRLLRVSRTKRQPNATTTADVVLVMGMPGAGKTGVACALESQGYARLNRDSVGGSLADLVPRLDQLLGAGQQPVVLDNTYPTRKSRNEIIEAAWERGAQVRCIWLTTDVANAQINSIQRMLDAHGSLPTPEQIRECAKRDTRYVLPDAQFRYERTLEPPSMEEGFMSVGVREFVRAPSDAPERAIILDFDDLIGHDKAALAATEVVLDEGRRGRLIVQREEGWRLFVHAWRPQIARNDSSLTTVEASFARLRELLGDVDIACCPHDAGPPICWCRKPIPGSVLEFARRRDVALTRSIVVGSSAADRTMAERVGAEFELSASFFGESRRDEIQ